MGKQDAGDNFVKKHDDNNNLKQDIAERLSVEHQTGSSDKAKGASTDKSKIATAKDAKDKVVVDDRSEKFLSQGTIQKTLSNQLVTLSTVAQQDPQTASNYPQWAYWLAEQNEKGGDVAAAQVMKEQGDKAVAVIAANNPNPNDATV